ncbi:transmembrane protein 14C-like [Takifugu rubripes]|nr:transmembrane protein 14C-like [Takifugu rubripes]XP_056913153.1 transmembrane protein 14C-like [Takifugu flavidus]|eukprot:XP_003975402.1 PREDICTED: transmembrane protein 14C-like [Takifugu rubripes]
MAVDWVGFTYAVLVTSGGLLGYVKAGSVASLAAGLLFGLFAALGAYMMSQNPKNILLSLGTSGTLTVVMGLRFLSSGKFMPAGFMTIVSLLMLLKIISGVITRPRHF